MTYGFIIVTALHAALVYIHHGTAPEIAEQINVGVARGEVVSQAIANATKTIEAEKQELSQALYNEIVSQVKRDLGMAPIEGTVFDRRKTYEQSFPVAWAKEDAIKAEARPLSAFSKWVRDNFMWDPRNPKDHPFHHGQPLNAPENSEAQNPATETPQEPPQA